MAMIWTSRPIMIRGELHADVKATDEAVTLGTYNDQVQASDLVLTPEQAGAIGSALITAAAACRSAQGR